MNIPTFTAEASVYGPKRHYRSAGPRGEGISNGVFAQSLLCARLGQRCGGIDLTCCPGLRCTAGLGGLGICVPDLFRCSPCTDGRQICCPPPGFGLRCFVRPCVDFRCSPCTDGQQICCPPPGFGLRCFVRPCVDPLVA
jgi:hypothetical protein